VFAVSPDNKLVPHPVELDGWTKGEWIVTKGITAGERILVEGFIKAHDPGMTVSPVPYVASAQGTGQGGAPAGAGKAPSEQVKPASSQDGTASSASK
jgi:membrane fusion protein (multidrug efflux system)